MKKLLLLLILLAFIPSRASATLQTTISISVTDTPDSQVWSNGSYATNLIFGFGTSTATSSPGPFGSLDGSGHASFVLTSANDITFPAGAVWQVTVCPAMGCAAASYNFVLPTVLGSTQNYNLTPQSFRQFVFSLNPTKVSAYRDSEVVSSALGSEYYNVTLPALKVCAALPCASNWQILLTTGGAGTGSVTNFSVTAIPSWLTPSVANPTTTPALTITPTGGQASHQVIGTCGSATSFAPCTLTLTDLGLSVPVSATVLGSNGSSQFIAAPLQGNGSKVQLSTGSTATGDCGQYDASGNIIDSGAACGTAIATGTSPNIAKFTSPHVLANSSVTDDGVNPTRAPNGLNTAVGALYTEWLVDTGGVSVSKLACRSGVSKVVICPAGATTTVLGVAQATVSAGGTALIGWAGDLSVISTNATTAGHWLIPSASVAGEVDDTGSSTQPTTGTQTFLAETSVSGGSPVLLTLLTPDTLNAAGTPLSTAKNTRVCTLNYGDKSGAALTTAQIQPQDAQCDIPYASTVTLVIVYVDAGASTVQVGYRDSGSPTAITPTLTPAAVSGITDPVACANVGGTAVTLQGHSVTCSSLTNTALTAHDVIETIGGTADGTSKHMMVAIESTVN
jgi:hypothetical protein